jgi:DNA-binding XRE family transcriptional regulator
MQQTISYSKFKKRMAKRKGYRKAYDALKPEYDLIRLCLDARLATDMTQAQLARKIGTKQSSIARLESGSYNPSVKFLQKVAKALGKTLQIRFVAAR